MLNAWINTRKVWYALYIGKESAVDENGDYTGETVVKYSAPKMTRANLSAARGTVEEDIFGANIHHTKTMATAKMNLGIDENTLVWDEEPALLPDGTADPQTAKYEVVRVARGHYHIHYALRQLNQSHGDSEDDG